MPSIAPWLNPPNFVGAAAAGAASGLGIRKANQEANEAADRLSLAYEQLAENERRANMENQTRLETQKASLALRGAQMDAMRAYHEDQIDARNRQIDNTAAYHQGTLDARAESADIRRGHEVRMGDQFQQHEERAGRQFGEREGRLTDQFNTRQENFDQTREDKAKAADALQNRFDQAQALRRAQFESGPGKLSPGDYAILDAKKTELKKTQAAIDKFDMEGGPSKGAFFGLTSWKDKRPIYKGLQDKAAQLLKDISEMETPKQRYLKEDTSQYGAPLPSIDDGGTPADYTWDPEARRIKKIAR